MCARVPLSAIPVLKCDLDAFTANANQAVRIAAASVHGVVFLSFIGTDGVCWHLYFRGPHLPPLLWAPVPSCVG